MTDKQIIIDGVPVQDCLFLATNKMGNDIGTYCRDFNGSCKNIQNCYFKRWQRKEQECEELKKQLTILDDEDVVVEITVKQFEEYKKLKQTLAEIKEIAEGVKGYDPLAKQILQKISEVE